VETGTDEVKVCPTASVPEIVGTLTVKEGKDTEGRGVVAGVGVGVIVIVFDRNEAHCPSMYAYTRTEIWCSASEVSGAKAFRSVYP
jgi:hypothetical protein